MNQTTPITQLQLFYTKGPGEKVYYKVHWTKKKEVFEGMNFKGYKGTEKIISGPFTTRAGAEGFINDLTHIPAFTGEFEIIEYK